jgi:hypothetical protein
VKRRPDRLYAGPLCHRIILKSTFRAVKAGSPCRAVQNRHPAGLIPEAETDARRDTRGESCGAQTDQIRAGGLPPGNNGSQPRVPDSSTRRSNEPARFNRHNDAGAAAGCREGLPYCERLPSIARPERDAAKPIRDRNLGISPADGDFCSSAHRSSTLLRRWSIDV